MCPFCTSDDVERDGQHWFCRCCAKRWLAYSKSDWIFLWREVRVDPQEPYPL